MGSPRRPTEFGYKARVADTAEGFVIADIPQAGNPNDDRLLAGAIAKAKDAGMRVDSVLADRGFGTKIGDQALSEHEIKRSVIPRRGRAAPIEATRGWAGATASATGSRAASPNSSARACAAPAYAACPGRRPGSAASPSPTTSSAWRCSPDPTRLHTPPDATAPRKRPPELDRPPSTHPVFPGEVALAGTRARRRRPPSSSSAGPGAGETVAKLLTGGRPDRRYGSR
jgi:hypothetical protein